jgi:hypothetical protein
MGRTIYRVLLMAALLVGVAPGCTRSAVKQKQPPDPLLLSKKPVEGKPTSLERDMSARLDFAPPPAPVLPPLPAGREFAGPGLQRDPISGVQIGFQPTDDAVRPVEHPQP